MKNFKPMDYAIKRLENVKPSMRYDGKEDFCNWQKKARKKLYSLLGLDKFEKCPFNVEVEYDREIGDRREIRFNFQTEEGYNTIARMTFPKHMQKPRPLCICLQGHSYGMHTSFDEVKFEDETAGENDRDYCLRAVKEGFCAVGLEQRNFGECGGRYPDVTAGCYRPSMYEIMLGRTTIGARVWDVMRLIDVITEKFAEFADVDNIVCMGNSGGGTATFYSACIDERIKTAMPSCAVSTFSQSLGAEWHCSCNFVPGIVNYFDMGDLAGLIAPRNLIQINGENDNIFLIDGAKECQKIAKQLYAAVGAEENCTLVIGPGGHRLYADIGWNTLHKMQNK